MTARRVRGVDPGERIGWTLLEDVADAIPRRIDGGTWEASEPDTWGPFRAGDVVAIERAEKPHPSSLMGAGSKNGIARVTGIIKGLLVAAWIGGRIADRVLMAGGTVIEVPASEARRAIGVKIGGRKGPACETCSGSGAGLEAMPGSQLAPDVAAAEGMELRKRAEELHALNERHATGKRKRVALLKAIRLKAVTSYPCPDCHGSGERKPPTVDQQIATLVPALVSGWPEISNVHTRDAAVTALHGFKIGGSGV